MGIKQTEALKLALEALEHDTEPEPKYGIRTAIDILREALAEQPAQPQQSPVKVGRITDNIKGMVLRQEVMLYTDDYLPIGTALYTSPPASKPWVGLTPAHLADCILKGLGNEVTTWKLIESKLKELNT